MDLNTQDASLKSILEQVSLFCSKCHVRENGGLAVKAGHWYLPP